jgi:hypothetical protein
MVGDETEVEWWAVAGVSHVAWLVLYCVVVVLGCVVFGSLLLSPNVWRRNCRERKEERDQDQRGSDGPSSSVVCPSYRHLLLDSYLP